MNSGIQALRHCDMSETMNFIEKIQNGLPKSSLAKQFYNLVTRLNEGLKGTIESPEGMFDALSEVKKVFCE